MSNTTIREVLENLTKDVDLNRYRVENTSIKPVEAFSENYKLIDQALAEIYRLIDEAKPTMLDTAPDTMSKATAQVGIDRFSANLDKIKG